MLKRWRGGARDKKRDGRGVTAGALYEGQTTHGSIFIHWHLWAGGAGAVRALSRITAISTYYPSCLSAERPCGHALAPGKLNGPLWAERQQGGRVGGGGEEGSGTLWYCQSSRSTGPGRDADSLWVSRGRFKPTVRHFCHGSSHQQELSLKTC